jgi:hypothetical protein
VFGNNNEDMLMIKRNMKVRKRGEIFAKEKDIVDQWELRQKELQNCPLFLSLLPKCHIVVPPLETCSTYKCGYDHACFCVYVYLWIYFPHMRKNMQPLSFQT